MAATKSQTGNAGDVTDEISTNASTDAGPLTEAQIVAAGLEEGLDGAKEAAKAREADAKVRAENPNVVVYRQAGKSGAGGESFDYGYRV